MLTNMVHVVFISLSWSFLDFLQLSMAARPMACPSQDSRFVERQVTWRKVLLFRVGATHFSVKRGGETVTLCQIVSF